MCDRTTIGLICSPFGGHLNIQVFLSSLPLFFPSFVLSFFHHQSPLHTDVCVPTHRSRTPASQAHTPSALTGRESITPPCRAGLLIRSFQLYVKHTDSQAPSRDSDLWGEAGIGVFPRSSGGPPLGVLPQDTGKCPCPEKQPSGADGNRSLTASGPRIHHHSAS